MRTCQHALMQITKGIQSKIEKSILSKQTQFDSQLTVQPIRLDALTFD